MDFHFRVEAIDRGRVEVYDPKPRSARNGWPLPRRYPRVWRGTLTDRGYSSKSLSSHGYRVPRAGSEHASIHNNESRVRITFCV